MVNYESLVKHLSVVKPRPFGLLSQQSSPTAELLHREFPDRMQCLFSAEHGWYGFAAAGEKTAGEIHPEWNIPVHSLYGETRHPTPEMMQGLGRVVIDLQDIGVRCYTYLATLKNMLEAAAEAKVAVTVLDRPIPLGGVVDGPMRDFAFVSFVAPLNIPFCHGMTPGECARYIAREEALGIDLTVIKMQDWTHASRAPWPNFMPPSPAIRSWDSAALYPATVFTEAYPAIDCDRNGSLAFRVVGAPWLDIAKLLDDFMDPLPACGMGVRPVRYRPAGGTYAGQTLNGLLLSVENPDAFYPVTAGAIILAALLHRHRDEMSKNARPEWLDKLVGSTALRDAIASKNLSDLFQSWIDAQDAYLPTKVDLYS
jgi:uncharacterized protein YbbC (DUF1343 family)